MSALAAALVVGCGAFGGPPQAFDCARGFHATDWREQTEKTAQSIDQCGWLDDMQRGDVVSLLGRPDDGGAGELSYSTGAHDGFYSYLHLRFENGRVRTAEATYWE